ncbi:hypothetical protein DSL72_003817 [Monilinia vaccinii-corymbosi]|uniref:Uncharacterized protein n=1 Tax=Monilinia vaccinii-corymbosi TaxID=61207 RepID=A0A8A3P0M5_9HELO|nr:hypothetical protein DSL72_003817 [Monilinia vaccinii-corymbosi]
MLGADNIIEITFGVSSIILKMVEIYLMCKQHKSREVDIEHGIHHEPKPIIADPEPVSILPHQHMRSLSAESDQAAKLLSSISHRDVLPTHPYGISSQVPRVQQQVPSQTIQPCPDTMEVTKPSDSTDSHIYYHSRAFLSNELE